MVHVCATLSGRFVDTHVFCIFFPKAIAKRQSGKQLVVIITGLVSDAPSP